MTWNISAEYISGVIVCIIFIYSHNGVLLPTLKNKIFQLCLLTTLGSIAFNVMSTLMLAQIELIPIWLTWVVTLIYFVFTPLMSMVYFCYVCAVAYENEDKRRTRLILGLSCAPYLVYLVAALLNPITGKLFTITYEGGYIRGPLVPATYVVSYIYIMMALVVVWYRHKYVDIATRRILMAFPLLAMAVVVIQQIYPSYILTGSAACCALLLLYLYLQNKQLSLDALTGLSNRREFLKLLRLRTKDPHDKGFFVMVVSINEFKFLNDKVGHENGDLFLKAIANYLKSITELSRLYRYNGDQFAILQDLDGTEKNKSVFNQMQNRFSQPWRVGNFNYMISVSIGAVSFPNTTKHVDGLINGLEYAISEAKHGSDNYCYCTPEMMAKVDRRNEIHEVLKERLEQNGFEVFLQPIYSLSKERFVLAESLLRLRNTKLGDLRPDEFIPIAEETGLIIDITYWVLEQVCCMLRKWMDEGREINGVAVNFSSLQFIQQDLDKRILAILKKYQIPTSKIKIEITEGILISNFDSVSEFITHMNQEGIRFALDDFGTGFSNLTSVLKLPFDTIKLDKSLVWDAVSNQKSAALVRHITRAFVEFGVNVLAEGVETEEQRDFIGACGCDYIQGFLYAKPMPMGDAAEKFQIKEART